MTLSPARGLVSRCHSNSINLFPNSYCFLNTLLFVQMSGSPAPQASVIPAQLSFLAIYNPSLGNTEETLSDQIVYYSSAQTRSRRAHRPSNEEDPKKIQEEENEKLRQIGLAQGMVDFAKWVLIVSSFVPAMGWRC
jgi:hypothetical protein